MDSFEIVLPNVTIRGRVRRPRIEPTVLFLHGGPGLSDYANQLDSELFWCSLASYTQRGPSPSPSLGPFDEIHHVRDAIAVIEKVLKPRRPVLVGHSWGGHLALHLAAARPELLRGIVLIEPFGITGDGGQNDISIEMDQRLSPEVVERANELDVRALAGLATDEELRESMDLFWPTYFANFRQGPAMPPYLQVSAACYGSTMASMAECVESAHLADRLQRISLPTVLLAGQDSPMSLAISNAVSSCIPGARLTLIPGAGHFPWFEAEGCVSDAVRRVIE